MNAYVTNLALYEDRKGKNENKKCDRNNRIVFNHNKIQ